MMRRIALLISVFLATAILSSAQQLDSAKRASLDAKLVEYLTIIEPAGEEVQKEECDFLIESCSDSLTRQYVAMKLYAHYFTSKLMGAETVAIHILDEWFLSGKVSMTDPSDLITARVYADFNRNSLIGMQAPRLDVFSMNGEDCSLYSEPSDRYSILYFYDTSCSSCKVETILLKALLEDEGYPVDLYAFYAGDDREAWEAYADGPLKIDSESVDIVHLWDPSVDSDFQRKYGVLQTPKIFLVRPDGKIAGRGLDVRALGQLLSMLFDEVRLQYGGDEAMHLFDEMFEGETSVDEVRNVSDVIAQSTLHKGDTLMFRQLAGDLLYYLAGQNSEGEREGLAYHIDRYILDENLDVWKTADDSLKVIGYAGIMADLLSKASPGTRISGLKVPGILLTHSGEKTKTMALDRIRGKKNAILFHTEGCNVCAAEIEAAHDMVRKDRRFRVFMVNIDEVLAEDPSLAARLFDAFDLSSLPYVIYTDKRGFIQSRYSTLQK